MKNKKTGYPHLDKPWMKYYEGRYIPEEPKKNVVEVLKDRNKARMSAPAYEYYGTLTSYEEMFNKVDNASKVLSSLGVGEKDMTISLIPNIPEDEHLLYGSYQIGANINYYDPIPGVDPKASVKKLLEAITKEKERAEKIGYNMKNIIVFDKLYPISIKPIENELKELGFENVILVNATDSMDEEAFYNYIKTTIDFGRLEKGLPLIKDDISLSELKELSHRIKNLDQNNRFLEEMIKSSPLKIHKYGDLLKECQRSNFEIATNPDLIAHIGHTSGTSGALPKPITLTHSQILSAISQCEVGGLAPGEGETVLHLLPSYAHYGRVNNSTQTYYSRGTSIHVPEFPMEHYAYLVKTLKPNVLMGTPAFLTSIAHRDYMQDEDLSFITNISYGGDSMRPEDERELNKFLREHNCRTSVKQAYGLSETAGAAAFAKDDYKRDNSIGIPMPKTIISIVDPEVDDKLVPLKFKEGEDKLEGEFVISGGEVTDAYLVDEGRIVLQAMPNDGRTYLRTGDVGYMDKDGISYSYGRKDRGFIRYDGYNFRPHDVEPEIENNKHVKNARTVPYYDEDKCGNMPICYLTLNEEITTEEEQIRIVEDIVNNTIIANPKMDLRQIPSKFKILDKMPYSKNNKIDFKSLERRELDGDEINVVVNQTNINTEGVEIFKNKKGVQRKRNK